MGRNKRHKKQMRSEKAKIKLKDNKTKFLPKGRNVTDASFKIKPILLPEQLKTYDSSVILSKRNLSIKDLLSRLDHHNKATKADTCDQLKQTIEDNKSVIIEHLPVLLKRLCPLILNEEHTTRQKVLKTIDVVLTKAFPDSLTPFYPILISFLRSSLTHINRSIREDSLNFLDILLHRLPLMLAVHSESLLPIYLSLISKHTYESPGNTGDASSPSKIQKMVGFDRERQQHVLSVDLGSSMTSAKWRIKVLGRLYGMLEAIGMMSGDGRENSEVNILNVCENKPYPLIINEFSDNSKKLYNYSKQTNDDGISCVTNNIQNILWIVFNTWAEVAPDKNNFINISQDTILPAETAEILNGILKIIYHLWHNILNNTKISLLHTISTEKFFNGLYSLFPFHKRVSNHKKQSSDSRDDQRCSQENLILCYIFALTNPKLQKRSSVESGVKVVKYLNYSLMNRSISQNNLVYLTKCLSIIFKKNVKEWKSVAQLNMDLLLTNTINFQITSTFNNELFIVLCDLLHDKGLQSLPAYETFLSIIPSLLCRKQVHADVINKLHWISVQKNKILCSNLMECMPDILQLFPEMQIIDAPCKYVNLKLKILHIFENCTRGTNNELEFFKAFVETFNEENEYSYYVKKFLLNK